MEILQKLKESESIVIEGDKKVGKLVFALYILNQKFNKISLISPLTSNKISKKIESIARSFENFNNLKEFVDIYAFREDWVYIKNEYGFDYLLQDLEFFISHQENEVILFHRIGSIFEYSDRDLIEDFFMKLLGFGIKYKKKLVFTLNLDVVNYDLISFYLVESSDLYLKIIKDGEIREIEILYALSPIIDKSYIFEVKSQELFLYPKQKSKFRLNDISVVVISKNEKIQRFHKYLLDKIFIDLEIIDSISTSLEAILKNPDFLIFSDESEDFSVCELSIKYKLHTSILYLINKDFLRIDDRLRAIQKGCFDVVNFKTQKMNYVLELEKYFSRSFYKISIINEIKKLEKKSDLLNFISYMLEEKILFSILKVGKEIENVEYLREYDKYIELEEYGIIILVNLLKDEISEVIFKKLNVHLLKVQDCLDIFFGEKLCID